MEQIEVGWSVTCWKMRQKPQPAKIETGTAKRSRGRKQRDRRKWLSWSSSPSSSVMLSTDGDVGIIWAHDAGRAGTGRAGDEGGILDRIYHLHLPSLCIYILDTYASLLFCFFSPSSFLRLSQISRRSKHNWDRRRSLGRKESQDRGVIGQLTTLSMQRPEAK